MTGYIAASAITSSSLSIPLLSTKADISQAVHLDPQPDALPASAYPLYVAAKNMGKANSPLFIESIRSKTETLISLDLISRCKLSFSFVYLDSE